MALPDGPGLNPIELVKFVNNPLACFQDNAAKYGDPFFMRFPGIGSMVITGDPAALKEIFTASPDTFAVGDPELLGPILGSSSMLVISGAEHKRQRQLLAPPFHGKRMRAYGATMCEVTEQIAARWRPEEPFNVLEAMQAITLGVIVRTVFGVSDLARARQYEELLREIIDSLGPLLVFAKPLRRDLGPMSPWGNFLRLKQRLSDLVQEEIEQRRSTPGVEREDILSLLMEAKDEAGEPMTDQEIKDELATLLVAGHETTAGTLAWALYFLHREPRIIEKLHEELELHPTLDGWAHAPFLGAVIQETLRYHPTVPETTRRVIKPFTLKGIDLPLETIVLPAIYLTHHTPSIYPNPETFRPERFLEKKFSPYEYLPFGGGHRRCIGYAFADYEMKMVLGTLCTRFDMRLAEGQTFEAERRNLAMIPRGGVTMIFGGAR